jgi:hypothetical protein
MKLAKHHEFFADYVSLIHRHRRLIEVDITELTESTREAVEAVEADTDIQEVNDCISIFNVFLMHINNNNELVRAGELTEVKTRERIDFMFRLLRLVVKSHETAVNEIKYAQRKLNLKGDTES